MDAGEVAVGGEEKDGGEWLYRLRVRVLPSFLFISAIQIPSVFSSSFVHIQDESSEGIDTIPLQSSVRELPYDLQDGAKEGKAKGEG